MASLTSPKPGFRVIVSRRDPLPVVEALEVGRGCSVLKRGPVTLIVLGEVLDENGFVTDVEILDRYEREGTACAANFDGAFVVLILGSTTAPALVITDPLNSLKCFAEETPASIVLASSLGFLPKGPRQVDPIALTSLLANGVVFNRHTIFEGVRALPRASVHEIDGRKGISSAPYWQYRFDQAYASRSRAELRQELAGLLRQAAAKRVKPAETIYLSLSGGYDSTCILGLLAQLRPARVECFSYGTSQAGDGSDEKVAAQMAARAGFPHREISSFNRDLPGLIRRNAALGEARSNFCGELDAWQALHEQMAGDGVIFVGDECFGWIDYRIQSDSHLLASIPIQKSSILAPYADCIDLPALGDGFDRELGEIVEATSSQPDWHDRKDFIYLDQRLGNTILPWRELFAGRCAPIRNLLLDRPILDFMSHLPSSLRRGKILYRETVREMFPELLGIRRAYHPSSNYIARAVYEQREAIEKELLGPTSPADDWLKPKAIARLFQPDQAAQTVSWKKRLIAFGRSALKRNRLALLMKGQLAPGPLPVSPQVMLLRILTLREYLRQP